MLFFTASDFHHQSHQQLGVLFSLLLCLFIFPGVISPLFSSSILGTYGSGECIFQCLSFCLFILFMGFSWTVGDRNAKVGSQETPGVIGKFGIGVQNEAGQRLIEFCQENALVIANTFFQQHMRRLHVNIRRWSTPKYDWLYSLQPKMEKLYTVSKNKTRIWLWLRSWTPIAKFRLR